jgi:hypothetical protein
MRVYVVFDGLLIGKIHKERVYLVNLEMDNTYPRISSQCTGPLLSMRLFAHKRLSIRSESFHYWHSATLKDVLQRNQRNAAEMSNSMRKLKFFHALRWALAWNVVKFLSLPWKANLIAHISLTCLRAFIIGIMGEPCTCAQVERHYFIPFFLSTDAGLLSDSIRELSRSNIWRETV